MNANEENQGELGTRTEQLREETTLSDQEAEILAHREQGLKPAGIADELEISRSQVSVALDRISQKRQRAKETASLIDGHQEQPSTYDQSILPEGGSPGDHPQIFLAPCVNEHAQQHFRDTVIDKVDVDIEPYRAFVPSRYQDRIAIWGTGEGNSSSAEAMEPGDVILFYVGENTYSHYAVVREVARNPELAENLWTHYDDTIRKQERENWPWVMYLSDPIEVDIDSEGLHETFGWSQSYPLGFTRVADHRVANLQTEHGSVQKFLEEMVTQAAADGTGEIPVIDMSVEPSQDKTGDSESSDRDLEELRQRAEEAARETANATTRTTTQYSRAPAVREYVMARADGVCEACGDPAPFEKANGDPYLEAHHVFKVSDEGMDDPDAVVAICPTCHCRIHHGEDGSEYNKELIEYLRDEREAE